MKGHKDKSGKFHPHNNSNNNVSSKDIMARNNISESKAKEGINAERLSTDAGIIKFLIGQGASKQYIDFVLRFPNSPSPEGWLRHWKDGFLDFGGGFGTALFNGDLEDAYFRADAENRGNLQKMGIKFARGDGTYDVIEDGHIVGRTTNINLTSPMTEHDQFRTASNKGEK